MFSLLAYLRTRRHLFEHPMVYHSRLKRIASSHTHLPTKARAARLLGQPLNTSPVATPMPNPHYVTPAQLAPESYVDRIRKKSAEELSAGPTRAVREAVAKAHAEGRSTVGSDKHGNLVRTHPDGREEPFIPTRRYDDTDDNLLNDIATAVAVETIVDSIFDSAPSVDDSPSIDTDAFSGGGGDFGGAGADGTWDN